MELSVSPFNIFQNVLIFFYFFAALRLHCCVWTFSSCSELWLLFGVVLRFLTAVVCVLEEHRLEGTWAPWLPGLVAMQHVVPGLGTEPMSPALAGRFLITGPPGESSFHYYYLIIIYLWGFLPPNPAILNSAGLEQTNVCPNGQMFLLNCKLRLPNIYFGLFMPLSQYTTTTTTNKMWWGEEERERKALGIQTLQE